MLSSPDHILTHSNCANHINHVSVHDSAKNFSDHLSLHFVRKFSNFLSLPLNLSFSANNSCSTGHNHSPTNSSVNWFKVNPIDVSSYCDHLLFIIPEFPIDILNCCDPDCTIFTTLFLTPSVFNFLTALLLLQISASLSTAIVNTILSLDGMMQLIPSNRLLAFGIKFGLNEVAPRPLHGVYSRSKKTSLRRFKYEVRRLHRRQCHIRRENLANALSHSSSQESWKQISKSSIVVHLAHQLPTSLMVVVMMVRFRIFSHLNLNRF